MCDTVVVVHKDRVLFAKNSDRDPNEAQVLDWQPARSCGENEKVKCTWIEIPQVSKTHAVLLSRPFWMWGAEIGANEHGVAIGNEAVFTKQPYAESGLTGMDLVRLGLERSVTADEALSVITGHLDAHGQGGGCGLEDPKFTYHNSFLIADPTSAFVLETAGKHRTVERVESGARAISNGLTIEGFARKHSDLINTHFSACRARRARTEALAQGAGSVADMIRVLRDHGEGFREPRYTLLTGGMESPCMHGGGIAHGSQTTGSWVADLRMEAVQHWVTGTAAPCTSLFKPVSVAEPVDLGPEPTDWADGESLWWRHEFLHRQAIQDPGQAFAVFERERDEVERGWFEFPPSPERAFSDADRLLSEWTDRVSKLKIKDRRPFWVRRYWRLRNRMAKLDLGAGQP